MISNRKIVVEDRTADSNVIQVVMVTRGYKSVDDIFDEIKEMNYQVYGIVYEYWSNPIVLRIFVRRV